MHSLFASYEYGGCINEKHKVIIKVWTKGKCIVLFNFKIEEQQKSKDL